MAKVINKVVYNNNTLIDLTQDTVTASKLAQGYTAHGADGAQITGTMPEGGGGEYDIEGTTLASGGQQLDITDAGGGSSITVEPITITTNGTTTAPSGTAYSPITVSCPESRYQVDANGNAIARTSALNFNNIKNIGTNAFYNAYIYCNALTGGVLFPELETVNTTGLYRGFYSCSGLTGNVSFPKLTNIGVNGLNSIFYGCTNLTGGVLFPELTTVADGGLQYAFYNCAHLTGSVSFPELTNVGSNSLYYIFFGCTGITEIHFKSSVRATIEAQATYDSKFGATNATIYFDLP